MNELKYCYKYPHPAVTTDSVVFGFDGYKLHVLLVERGVDPYKGMWALPGGFMRLDETAEQCAVREPDGGDWREERVSRAVSHFQCRGA